MAKMNWDKTQKQNKAYKNGLELDYAVGEIISRDLNNRNQAENNQSESYVPTCESSPNSMTTDESQVVTNAIRETIKLSAMLYPQQIDKDLNSRNKTIIALYSQLKKLSKLSNSYEVRKIISDTLLILKSFPISKKISCEINQL